MAAHTTSMNIRVDTDLKRMAEAVYSELGLNLSTAMNIFLRYSIRYGGLPFELRLETPNAETLAAIDDVKNNRNMSRTFSSVAELMEDLNA